MQRTGGVVVGEKYHLKSSLTLRLQSDVQTWIVGGVFGAFASRAQLPSEGKSRLREEDALRICSVYMLWETT
jgi:hypothetical protein